MMVVLKTKAFSAEKLEGPYSRDIILFSAFKGFEKHLSKHFGTFDVNEGIVWKGLFGGRLVRECRALNAYFRPDGLSGLVSEGHLLHSKKLSQTQLNKFCQKLYDELVKVLVKDIKTAVDKPRYVNSRETVQRTTIENEIGKAVVRKGGRTIHDFRYYLTKNGFLSVQRDGFIVTFFAPGDSPRLCERIRQTKEHVFAKLKGEHSAVACVNSSSVSRNVESYRVFTHETWKWDRLGKPIGKRSPSPRRKSRSFYIMDDLQMKSEE